MKKLHKISVDFPFFLVKNRSAVIMVKLSCWSRCVNKIGQIMKSFSYSYGLTSLTSRVNTGTKLHKDRGVDHIIFPRILVVLPKCLRKFSS